LNNIGVDYHVSEANPAQLRPRLGLRAIDPRDAEDSVPYVGVPPPLLRIIRPTKSEPPSGGSLLTRKQVLISHS